MQSGMYRVLEGCRVQSGMCSAESEGVPGQSGRVSDDPEVQVEAFVRPPLEARFSCLHTVGVQVLVCC